MEFLEDQPKGGNHVSVVGGDYEKSIKKALEDGKGCIQLFLETPRRYHSGKYSISTIKRVKTLVKENNFPVFVHAAYVYNLYVSVDRKKRDDEKKQKIIEGLQNELDITAACGFRGAVVHIGSSKYSEAEDEAVIKDVITKVLTQKGPITSILASDLSITPAQLISKRMMILENCAGAGTTVGRTINCLDEIRFFSRLHSQIFFCIDTCHIFAAGTYDLSEIEEVEKMFKEIDAIGGIILFHLNDSKIPFGGKVDRHAILGTDQIWGDSIESLILLVKCAKKRNIPLVCETSGENDWLKIYNL